MLNPNKWEAGTMSHDLSRRALMGATAGSLLLAGGNAGAQQKPSELRVGITTFLSGGASVFGVPA
jgi:branched-chain amino acid transport system substrate-binding protein